MSEKRHQEDNHNPEEKRQRRDSLRSIIIEATRSHALQKLLSVLEPLFRKVVKEEVEEALAKHLVNRKRYSGKQIYPSSSQILQLLFVNKLSLPIFTGTKIEGEGSLSITVALVDTLTGEVVRDGPESSAQVEVVVLEGDFEGDEKENWTFEEFNENIVRERDGKRPLLVGDSVLTLSYGSRVISELTFTDNSSWTRSRKFRLGARVADGHFNGVRVKEARTESFVVKDHRGELYKKHYPPSLNDEVWRLEKIGKDGAFHRRLSRENIVTVKDFLTVLSMDYHRLKKILGPGMSTKMWEATLEHARTCILSNKVHAYYTNDHNKTTGVLFNEIGELLGLVVEQQCIPVKELTALQMANAQKLVADAYGHWEDVILLGDGAETKNFSSLLSVLLEGEVGCKVHNTNNYNNPIGYNSMQSRLHPMLGIGCQEHSLPSFHGMDFEDDPELNGLLIGVGNPFAEHLQYFDELPTHIGTESQADLAAALSGFLPICARKAAHSRWGTLGAVLKWRFSIKRIVASNKRKRCAKKVIN